MTKDMFYRNLTSELRIMNLILYVLAIEARTKHGGNTGKLMDIALKSINEALEDK